MNVDTTLIVISISRYQPSNVNPDFVGVGSVPKVVFSTLVWLSILLPPSTLKLIVKVVVCVSSGVHFAYSVIFDVTTVCAVTSIVFALSLNHPSNVNPDFVGVGSVPKVIFSTLVWLSILLPPSTLKLIVKVVVCVSSGAHFAYSVIFDVTTVCAVTSIVFALSLNHPSNVNPDFVGVGSVPKVIFSTLVWLSILLPPSTLKLIVKVVVCVSSGAHFAYSVIFDVTTVCAVTSIVFA